MVDAGPRPGLPFSRGHPRALGDVLNFDSWLLRRVNSNVEAFSKIGIVQVFCRPDCLPLSKFQSATVTGDDDQGTGEVAVQVDGDVVLRTGNAVPVQGSGPRL